MQFYTYLESTPCHQGICQECELDLLPENLRESTLQNIQNLKQHPECQRYYQPLIRNAKLSRRQPDIVYSLMAADDICYLLLKKMTLPYEFNMNMIALVEAEPKHKFMSEPEIWHTTDIVVLDKWHFGQELVQHLADVWGEHGFWQRWSELVTVAIHTHNFDLYQWLTAMHTDQPRPKIVPRRYYLLGSEVMNFLTIATLECRIDFLTRSNMRHIDVLEVIRSTDWTAASQSDINWVASKLMTFMTTAQLKAVRAAGLTFDAGCVYCSLACILFPEYHDSKADVMPFCHSDWFRELGFPETCRHVCYVKACLCGDIRVMRTLQPEMPYQVVLCALMQKIHDAGLGYMWQNQQDLQTMGTAPASDGEVLDLMAEYLQGIDSATVAEGLHQTVMHHLTPNCLPLWQRLVNDTWPEELRTAMQDKVQYWQRIHLFDTVGRVDGLDLADVMNHVMRRRDQYTPERLVALTREIPIPLAIETPHNGYFCPLFSGGISWGLYLIFVAQCSVEQVVELAAEQGQGYHLEASRINHMLTPGGVQNLCTIHPECYYPAIMTPALATVCQDLMRHNILTPDVQEKIQPWLSTDKPASNDTADQYSSLDIRGKIIPYRNPIQHYLQGRHFDTAEDYFDTAEDYFAAYGD